MVTDHEITNILETGTRPKKGMKMLSKVKSKVQLFMVAETTIEDVKDTIAFENRDKIDLG